MTTRALRHKGRAYLYRFPKKVSHGVRQEHWDTFLNEICDLVVKEVCHKDVIENGYTLALTQNPCFLSKDMIQSELRSQLEEIHKRAGYLWRFL